MRLSSMRFVASGRARWVALVVVVLGLAAGGIAYASIPDSSGVIHGCYAKINGQLRVIDTDAGGKCTSGEKSLSWNQTGPQGPPGVLGFYTRFGPGGNVPPGGVNGDIAVCDSEDVATGGGFHTDPFIETGSPAVETIFSYPLGSDAWSVRVYSPNLTYGFFLRAYVKCADITR